MRRAWLVLAALVLGACTRSATEPPAAAGPLLPDLAKQLPTIDSIELRTAGDRVAVTLERKDSAWTVRERTGWPADPAMVDQLLDDLESSQRVEPKTAKRDHYARIGVEPVTAVDAGGVEVRLHGKGWNESVIVGNAPPVGAGRFVRRAADAQSWQVDRKLDVAREPAQWLDTRMFDVPLARISSVSSKDAVGHSFALAHRDDRFRIADAPSAAMGDSYRGDALAGLLTDLHMEDVAADEGVATAERTVTFTAGGSIVEFEAWRLDGRVWVRVRDCPLPPPHVYTPQCVLKSRWNGRRFMLPAHVAAKLLMTRDQILGHTP
jgi:hypothetical protein